VEIVRLQNGNCSTSAYCLPTAGGSIDSYFELAKAMGPEHLIYGIQFADRAPAGKFREFASLREMATAMVPGLLAHHREGPICLIGYSFAAYLAIEMAQLLVGLGKSVPLVAMIDKTPPSASFTPLLRMKHFVGNVFPFVLRMATRSISDSKRRLDYLNVMSRKLRGRHKFVGASWYQSLPKNHQDYVSKNLVNLRNYRFDGVYRGKILLFRVRPSAERDAHPWQFSQLEDYGWGCITGASVDVVYSPGDHGSIMQNHNVVHMAKALRLALSECDLRAPRTMFEGTSSG
jgi:thioesterase domain-containing protein